MGFSKNPFLDPYNSRGRASAILKIVKSPYRNEKSSGFDEIWYTTADSKLDNSPAIKYIYKNYIF